MVVASLDWHEGSGTLIAKCRGHTGRFGRCYTENWRRMKEGYPHDCTWWPTRFALRRPGHFPRNFCAADDACFFYMFTSSNGRNPGWIPDNDEPHFADTHGFF